MSILSTFKKYKDYILTSNGYQLSSRWTKSDAVVMGDGTDDTNTLEKNLGSIQGITDSLTATSSNIALSAKGANDMYNELNSNLIEMQKNIFDAPINIAAYTTTSFICPSDGYIKAIPNGNNGDYIIVYINDVMIGIYRCLTNNCPIGSSIYVRKGMKVNLAYNIEPTAEFIPIK